MYLLINSNTGAAQISLGVEISRCDITIFQRRGERVPKFFLERLGTHFGDPSLPSPPIPSLLGPDFNAYLPSTLIANVRSLVPKVDELEQTIKMNDADMICLTETWLHPSILDSVLFLSNYVLFRKDRLSSIGGGVCIYVNAKLHCRRLTDFESPSIESLWLSIRPRYLPRSISIILLAVIYHSTSAGALENSELYDHIQSNVDSYLSHHPDALVMVTGDFNPVSTGFAEKLLKRLSGLRQIVNVPIRNDAILNWCLVNLKEPTFLLKQLPPVGSSDHNALLVGPYVQRRGGSRPMQPMRMHRSNEILRNNVFHHSYCVTIYSNISKAQFRRK